MTDKDKSTLRREATPQQPHQLTESQAKAATSLLKTLMESLKEIEKEKPEEKGRAVDANRKNRLLFWSGEPGVGKTSTYVSVRSWFEEELNVVAREPQTSLKEQKALLKAIEDLTGKDRRVRWLDALDLELLSGRPNFLAAVLARISDALGTANTCDSHWTQSGDSERREAEKDFLRLQNDIALSWDGNLRERGHALEPDVYASEVMRAEQARLNVNRRFREVLAKLARHVPDRGSKEPALFILPIDDFYLKPDVTLELLRFLRMISSPHLFVLIMGDIDVVEDLLFWNNVGEASRLIQPGGSKLLNPPAKENIRLRAMSMATAAIDKLIPKNQQIRIDTMTPEETLLYPTRGTDSIKHLLEQTELKFLVEQAVNKDLDTPGWYFRDALQITPRQAADLHQGLVEFCEGEEEESTGKAPPEDDNKIQPEENKKLTQKQDEKKWALCELVAKQVERALFSDAKAVPRDSANLIFEAMRDPHFLWRWRFPENVVVKDSEKPFFKLVFVPENGEKGDGQVCPSEQVEQKNAEQRGNTRDTERTEPLSPLLQAWLAVLHDLLIAMDVKGDRLKVLNPNTEVKTVKIKLYEYFGENNGANVRDESGTP